jgi:hypothetical protein
VNQVIRSRLIQPLDGQSERCLRYFGIIANGGRPTLLENRSQRRALTPVPQITLPILT